MSGKSLKLYYSASEVAKELGETPAMISHWEKTYGLKLPKAKYSNRRLYRKQDLDTMRLIKYLIRDKKLNHKGVKEALALRDVDEIERRAKAMAHFKSALDSIEIMIKSLDAHRHRIQKRKLPEKPLLSLAENYGLFGDRSSMTSEVGRDSLKGSSMVETELPSPTPLPKPDNL